MTDFAIEELAPEADIKKEEFLEAQIMPVPEVAIQLTTEEYRVVNIISFVLSLNQDQIIDARNLTSILTPEFVNTLQPL